MTYDSYGLSILLSLAFLFILISSGYSGIDEQTFVTNGERITLVELFTSEGCSSCPPAEAWLSQFKSSDQLWDEIIPIAFHVNFWDGLGWVDRFATPTYTKRHYKYKDSGNLTRVYTPAFLVNGQEWPGWFQGEQIEPERNSSVGTLKLVISNNDVVVTFIPLRSLREEPRLHLAILGFGLKSEISRGENKGNRLTHDFVVVGYKKSSMNRRSNMYFLDDSLPFVSNPATKTQGIAAWISRADNQRPIQAVGGWLNKTSEFDD